MNKPNRLFIQGGLLAALALSSGLLAAQPTGDRGGQRRPPPEALAACKSLSSGQDCSFTSPNGTVNGACRAPADKALACVPKDAPSDGMRPPRQ